MPLRLDIKRQLSARSDRVKCVDMHPAEPWILVSMYNGAVSIWNYETQTCVKSFEVAEVPVRCGRFVQRKNWVITASDDMQIRVFNYNTLDKVHSFEAHSDYIRAIAVHPNQPYLVSSSDDMMIKVWDWDKQWQCSQVLEGHTHYVMAVMFNPKDTNTFASVSLDRTVKVWQLGASQPNFTLSGHEKGVNCVDYFQGGDKPYLVTGADDRLVKIWDYQNKTCVQTLDGHTHNVTAVCFHPELPLIMTGSEDGTVRVWHANTYRLENTLNYGMERVWTMAYRQGSNSIAIGYDEGTIIIKLGREEPAMSMDNNGKIIMAKHNEVQQVNVSKIEEDVKDGEILAIGSKDLGSCEMYPQTLRHNPNGRFVVVCGDGEFVIHTALSFRNKAFGHALEFVWSSDSSQYATRENSSAIKIFKNFKEKSQLKPDFSAEGIYGGHLLGVRGSNALSFYDWETLAMIRRIEIEASNVFWSDSAELVSIVAGDSTFILKFDQDAVENAFASGEEIDEDEGIEAAFEVLGEIPETVKTATWVGDCFIYTNSVNRLNYFVGGEIVTIAHLDRPMYLLGYLNSTSRLYLGDKDLSIVTYTIHGQVLEYQTAVMRHDFEAADALLPSIPLNQRSRVAHFLEKQDFKEQALVVSNDDEHRFELALSLGKLDIAREIATSMDDPHKWKVLGEKAMRANIFPLAEQCLEQAGDLGGRLLLYTSTGKANKLTQLAEDAQKDQQTNIAFMSLLLTGKLNECVDLLINTKRLPEAALFARTYIPSEVSRVVALWKESLGKKNGKAAQALADPAEYPNLFPDMEFGLQAQAYLASQPTAKTSARQYSKLMSDREIPLQERVAAAGGNFAPPAATEPEPESPGPDVEESVNEDSLETTVVTKVVETVASVVETVTEAVADPGAGDDDLDDIDAELDAELEAEADALLSGDMSDFEDLTPHAADWEGARINISHPIEFDGGAATIKDLSYPILDKVAETLNQTPEIKLVEVGGHTADVGDDPDTNQMELELSQDRATSVKDYLVGKGVSADRLLAIGFGDNIPIAPNDTKEGRAINRRVEFVILDPTPTQLAEVRGNQIVLNEVVSFGGNAANILEESHEVLLHVVEILEVHPEFAKIEVGGHCADVGDSAEADAREMKISQDRADAVVAFLVENGIEPERLVAKGYGDSQPIASNKNKEGRKKNRRVEFHVL